MRFKDQILWTALAGSGSFVLGAFLWLGSQAAGVASDSWAVSAAWLLVMVGLLLVLWTAFRAANKRGQLRSQRNGAVHIRATLGPFNRWYYWVDRNGKDRNA